MTPLSDLGLKNALAQLSFDHGAPLGDKDVPKGQLEERLTGLGMRRADISLRVFEAYLKLQGLGLEAGGWGEVLKGMLGLGLAASVKIGAKRASAYEAALDDLAKPIVEQLLRRLAEQSGGNPPFGRHSARGYLELPCRWQKIKKGSPLASAFGTRFANDALRRRVNEGLNAKLLPAGLIATIHRGRLTMMRVPGAEPSRQAAAPKPVTQADREAFLKALSKVRLQ